MTTAGPPPIPGPSPDDVGITRLGAGDVPWREVPEQVREDVLRSISRDDLHHRIVAPDGGWKPEVQRRLLHPSTGLLATAVSLPPAASVLVIGTGAPGLGPALHSLGARVTRVDWVYARLRFAQLIHPVPQALAVHDDLGSRLPFPDSFFDVIHLDLAAMVGSGPMSSAAHVIRPTLSEAARVLAPAGTLVIRAPNARFVALQSLRRGEVPAWAEIFGRTLNCHLRTVGLRARRLLAMGPDATQPTSLIPEERLSEALLTKYRGTTRKRAVTRVATTLGRARWLLSEHVVLARPAQAPAGVQTLSELLVGTPDSLSPITDALSDARVAVSGDLEFAKVPLSDHQQSALVEELEKTRLARTTGFAPFVLWGGRLENEAGIPHVVYPYVTAADADLAAREQAVVSALIGLGEGRQSQLQDTALWRRLTSPRGQSDIADLGAQALWSHVREHSWDAILPVGPSHGDLHPDNVLIPRHGNPLLVDWNRFETNNPLLLDAKYAAVRFAGAKTGDDLADGIAALADGTLTGPLVDRADLLRGDLEPLPAATLVLLDRVASYSLPRLRHKPWTAPPLAHAVNVLTSRWSDHPLT